MCGRYGGVTFGATYPWTAESTLAMEGFNNKPDNLRVRDLEFMLVGRCRDFFLNFF